MKKILVLIALLLTLGHARPAESAISFVCAVNVTGANGGTSGSTNCSGANLFVLGLTESSSLAATISDSTSATWTHLTEQCVSTPCNVIYYAKNVTGSGTNTFTISCSSCFAAGVFMGFSGADTTAPFDQENGTGGGGFHLTAQPGSITPGSNNELVVTSFGYNNTQTFGAGSVTGYTEGGAPDFTGGTNYGGGGYYQIQTTATATNPSWALAQDTAGDITVASFKAGAGGGAAPAPRLLLLGVGGW